MFDNLPRYVASGPDNMPSSRIFEGDLKTLLKRLEQNMSGQIAECKAGMLALSRDVSSLQIAAQSAPESSITHRPVASESSVLPPTCDQQQWPALAPRRSAVDSGNYAETESKSVINQPSGEAPDWATIAYTWQRVCRTGCRFHRRRF